jgi:hypothetical protein
MKCRCGGFMRVIRQPDGQNHLDRALGQATRVRQCDRCKADRKTVELYSSEVQSMRLAVHTLVMQRARAGGK